MASPAGGAGSTTLRRQARFELAAVAMTGAAHLLFEEVLHQKTLFIAAAMAAWIAYVVLRQRRDRNALAEWGFRVPGLGATVRLAGGATLAAAAAIAVVAATRGRLAWNPHLLPILAIYPAWGLIQQFLVQGLVARNLARLGVAPVIVVPLAAALFAAVHWPDPRLMAATALLGLGFTPIYLRHRNLWPLGVFHGWLGALVYFGILGRDPWTELLGR